MAHPAIVATVVRAEGVRRRIWTVAMPGETVNLVVTRTHGGGRRDPMLITTPLSQTKLWSVDVGYRIAVAALDSVCLGGTWRITRRHLLIDDQHGRSDSMLGLSLRWNHADRFNVTGGWSTTMVGRARSSFDRLTALASRMPIPERGFRLDASTCIGGPDGRLSLGGGVQAMTARPVSWVGFEGASCGDLRGAVTIGMRL